MVHQASDADLESVSQTLKAPLDLAVKPVVRAGAALDKTLAPSKQTRDIRNLRAGKAPSRLVVDALGAKPRLAWEVKTVGRQSDGTPSRLATYVDARTGTVIRRVEGIHTADGQGTSLYSGTVPISVTQNGSTFTLTDAAHGNAATTDMQNKEDSILCTLFGIGCSNGVAYSSPDTSFGTGTNANRESAAVDAHYGGATTFDYFKNVQGRNGIFGDGAGAPSRVHYGNGYVNAFWDGSKMTYGDGDGSTFGPLVSLDVAGHEMSHGVTENTSNLTYSGESGGLNEATSDIFGTMVEFYAANANDPGDYYIGEEFDLANGRASAGWTTRSSTARRTPATSRASATPTCTTPRVSATTSSTCSPRARAPRRSAIRPTTRRPATARRSPASAGRGAAKIWFRALTTYFTSGTTYAQARTGTLNAARDLFGEGSTQYSAVATAWSAVNVG